jgi:hypothetical protein
MMPHGVDGGDVAGVEPAFGVEALALAVLGAGILEIGGAPRPARARAGGRTSCRRAAVLAPSSSTIFISTPNGGRPCFSFC